MYQRPDYMFPPPTVPLQSLELVDLKSNDLSDMPPRLFLVLKSVTQLGIARNNLTALPADIKHLVFVEKLDLYVARRAWKYRF